MSEFHYPPEIWARLPRPAKVMALADELSLADVTAYFTAKGAQVECAQCGANAWEIYAPDTTGHFDVSIERGFEPKRQRTSIPTIVLTCTNCALLRTHAAMLIASWKLDHDGSTPGA